ncbi:arylamine N-acetyltransferase 2 [Mariannaea sp. PMI_226]|nr:arylamine N-acetyltransferase 2 [Mariannaea sp. PMI_226]
MAPIYSETQVAGFLSHIKIPSEYYSGNEPLLDHAFLSAIHKHMIMEIPYENLLLHYSDHRSVTLDPEVLYSKFIVSGRGRGGYCMENSLFLYYMLQTLGFQTYLVGVRVRARKDGIPIGGYLGWVHVVNIVTLADNTRWVLDVSFGGDGPTQPMALVENIEWRNLGTQDARLIRDFVPGQTELTPGRRMWIYQVRNSSEQSWVSHYTFSDALEWLPTDFEVSNHFTSTSTKSFQTTTVLVVKFLGRPCATSPGGQEVYGKRILFNDVVKENTGGRSEVVAEVKTEDERIKALKEWLGIVLTDEEIQAIKGHHTEIKESV